MCISYYIINNPCVQSCCVFTKMAHEDKSTPSLLSQDHKSGTDCYCSTNVDDKTDMFQCYCQRLNPFVTSCFVFYVNLLPKGVFILRGKSSADFVLYNAILSMLKSSDRIFVLCFGLLPHESLKSLSKDKVKWFQSLFQPLDSCCSCAKSCQLAF